MNEVKELEIREQMRNFLEGHYLFRLMEIMSFFNLQKEKKQIIERKQPTLAAIFELGKQVVIKEKENLSFEISEIQIDELFLLTVNALTKKDDKIFEEELDEFIKADLITEDEFHKFLKEKEEK